MNVRNNRRLRSAVRILLAGCLGFFLGGLAVFHAAIRDRDREPIVLEPLPFTRSTDMDRVYASSRGKRFYPWWCDTGSSIVKENLVWFATVTDARAAGYTIARSCEG